MGAPRIFVKVANASPTVLTLAPLRCAKRWANGV